MGRSGRDSGLEMTELHGLGDVFIECRRVEDGCVPILALRELRMDVV